MTNHLEYGIDTPINLLYKQSRMKTTSILLLSCVGSLVAAFATRGADPLLEFTFNDSGPTTEVTMRSLWDWPLAFQTQDGATADWHGALGTGVSGQSADRAFDNSAATGMGSGGLGGRAFGVPHDTTPLDSVTFSGWFRASGVSIGGFARLFFWDGPRQVFAYPDSSLYFAADGNRSIGSDAAYTEVDEWVFFAVTFDGTQTTDNVRFWKGTRSNAVSLVSTRSLPAGPFDPGYYQFAIGNSYSNSSPTQPLDGWLDNFRLHGGQGTNGLLSLQELENLRAQDVTGALPPIRIRVRLELVSHPGPPAGLTFGWWSIAGYNYQVEQSTNLVAWADAPGIATSGDGTRQEQTLTPPPATPRFYRLRVTQTSP